MIIVLLIIFAVLLRFLPHMPNFAPITAIALFSGAKLEKKYALVLPLVAMAISDFFLGGYHSTMPFVYLSFLISGLIGLWLRKHNKVANILGGSLVASIQFFIITNFGVWATSSMYPHNLEGLMQSYFMGIPFFRGTFLGDLFFTGFLFLSYEFVMRASKAWSLSRNEKSG